MNMRVASCMLTSLVLAAAAPACHATCFVSAVNLAFGGYDSLRIGHTDSTGNVAVTCTGKSGNYFYYTLALNAGGAGTFATRRMRSATPGALNYNIYLGANRSVVWGNGSGGSSVITDVMALNSLSGTRNYPIYGRIFARQNAPAGIYSDSIVVTLEF